MTNKENDFLRSNEINLSEDLESLFPDKTFTILQESLRNYYSTAQIISSFIFRNYINKVNGEPVVNNAVSHLYLDHYYSTMLYAQIFLELYIKSILEKVHPAFIKARLNKDVDLIHALTGNLNAVKIGDRSVSFSIVINRLELIIQNHDKLPVFLQLHPQYHFFLDYLSTIRKLTEIRNQIVHDANIILTAYAFDFFYSTKLIPLFNEILKLQSRRQTPMDRNVACGINVLQEISEVNLSEDYEDKNILPKILNDLKKLNHIKELGRASLENPLFMGEFPANTDAIEQHHNLPIKKYGELEAKLNAEHLGYDKIFDCPCCGTHSLCTYERWTIFQEQKIVTTKAQCFVCSYRVTRDMGEPVDFGIMKERIFV